MAGSALNRDSHASGKNAAASPTVSVTTKARPAPASDMERVVAAAGAEIGSHQRHHRRADAEDERDQ